MDLECRVCSFVTEQTKVFHNHFKSKTHIKKCVAKRTCHRCLVWFVDDEKYEDHIAKCTVSICDPKFKDKKRVIIEVRPIRRDYLKELEDHILEKRSIFENSGREFKIDMILFSCYLSTYLTSFTHLFENLGMSGKYDSVAVMKSIAKHSRLKDVIIDTGEEVPPIPEEFEGLLLYIYLKTMMRYERLELLA